MVELITLTKTFLASSEKVVGSEGNDAVTILQRNYCMTAFVYNKFQRLCELAFIGNEEEIRQTWTLFLIGKLMYFMDGSDLHSLAAFLFCCLANSISRTAAGLLKTPFDIIAENALENEAALLEHISKLQNMSFEKIMYVRSTTWTKFQQSITKIAPVALQNRDETLNQKYNDVYMFVVGFDERHFISHSSAIAPKARHSSLLMYSGDHIPTVAGISSMQSNDSVSQILSAIQKVYPQCDQHALITDFREMIHDIKTTAIDGTSSTLHFDLQLQDAIQLYWKKLLSMLSVEKHKNPSADLGCLLNTKCFHRCLLAMSVQVQFIENECLTSNQCPPFPWIATVLNFQVYDFFRIIESFLLHEPYASSSSIQYFKKIQEDILLQLVWQKNSKVFSSIRQVESNNVHCDKFTKDRTAMLLSGKDIKSSHSTRYFIRKVRALTFKRMKLFCGKLGLAEDSIATMWECFDSIVLKHPSLLIDRHLDQIIMCCVYSVAKVIDKEVQFKEIVTAYRLLKLGSDKIFQEVHVEGQHPVSIIAFYNSVFMPTAKNVVLEFGLKRRIAHEGLGSENSTPQENLTPRSKSFLTTTPKEPMSDSSNQIVPMSDSSQEFTSPLYKRQRIDANFTYTQMQ